MVTVLLVKKLIVPVAAGQLYITLPNACEALDADVLATMPVIFKVEAAFQVATGITRELLPIFTVPVAPIVRLVALLVDELVVEAYSTVPETVVNELVKFSVPVPVVVVLNVPAIFEERFVPLNARPILTVPERFNVDPEGISKSFPEAPPDIVKVADAVEDMVTAALLVNLN